MKKIILLSVCTALSVLILCSCSLLSNLGGILNSLTDTDAVTYAAQTEEVYLPVDRADLDGLSLDELLALYDKFLQSGGEASYGAEYDLYYKGAEISGGAGAEIDPKLAENAQTAVYSDGPWADKTYETLDITANMSDEEKAGYNAAIAELENFDADEFQNGIDEMLKGMDGFENYDPEAYTDSPSMLDEWPDNNLTGNVPKPPFENAIITADSDSVTLFKNGAELSDVKTYISDLKKAGFTKDAYEQDNSVAGISIHTYNANNGNGLFVSVTFTNGTATVNISKNQEVSR